MYYSRNFSPDMIKELKELIQEEVEKQMMILSKGYEKAKKVEESSKYVSLKEACKALNISRQTLFNWEKENCNKMKIDSFIKFEGSRKLYNIVGIENMRNVSKW